MSTRFEMPRASWHAVKQYLRNQTWVLLLGLLVMPGITWSEAKGIDTQTLDPQALSSQALDQEVQQLKEELLELNRDLFILEEELLAPSDTQVSVFLSMDIGTYFSLDSVQLTLDDKVVTHYLYTPREIEALHRGGVHRLYVGNLKSGEHEVVALFVGKGPKGRDYRRGATIRFDKALGPKYLELKIVDNQGKQQPDFEVKEWE